MKRTTSILTAIICLISVSLNCNAQQEQVNWSISSSQSGSDTFVITLSASIEKGWHIYDCGPYEGGPNPTIISFRSDEGIELIGGITCPTEPVRKYDRTYGMEIGYFENSASFNQTIRLKGEKAKVTATAEWMSCNNYSCIPPQERELTIELTRRITGTASEPESSGTVGSMVPPDDTAVQTIQPEESVIAGTEKSEITDIQSESNEAVKRIWILVIQAILWGLAALATPCVFPMVPMTVSYFIKGSENKATGRFRAFMYGLFIILLYTVPIALIILITRVFGGESVTGDLFNWLATHWLPNLLFFIVFMLFAASFFGAFEITMPSKLVNDSDRKSDKKGLGGVFFMALTLVLVSFSCTGPIVGTVLIKSTSGEFWTPMVTMLAFSTAFALPFTLFALFPAWLKKLPKSGGWLNTVKVVLGFIEIALGFKFLSVADQTYLWGILDREVYLAIWIVVFALLGFYLLGKIRFKFDPPIEHVSVTRLALAIAAFAFVVYMIPGMWGAPLKAISGYLPPIQSQDFVIGKYQADSNYNCGSPEAGVAAEEFFNIKKAEAYAEKVDKPLFIDFTGLGCTNCREMEARVLSDKEIQRILREEYVIVTLYGDDKRSEVAEEEWITTDNGKVLKNLGKINSYYMLKEYGINAQPYYLLKGPDGLLAEPRGYNLDIDSFKEFLLKGLDEYSRRK